MGRIRTVKPELFKHEALFELERDTGLPVRLAFIGLFTVADRQGRFKWRPMALGTDVLPYDGISFSRVLDALATRGFLVKYEVGGEVYGCIPTFSQHQVINNRESESLLPDVEKGTVISVTYDDSVGDAATRAPRVEHACVTPLVQDQGEGKGREGNRNGTNPTVPQQAGEPRPQTVEGVIFDHWRRVMDSPRSKLDGKREKIIKAALKWGYTPEQLCKAIDGCRVTPHNMGINDRGEKYNGIDLILRNADQIDRFLRNADNPPKFLSKVQIRQAANGRVADGSEFLADVPPEYRDHAPAGFDGMTFEG